MRLSSLEGGKEGEGGERKEEGRHCRSFGQGVTFRGQWVTPEHGEDLRDKSLRERGSSIEKRNLLLGNLVLRWRGIGGRKMTS